MKKLFFILLILLVGFFIYRFVFKKPDRVEEEQPQALAVSSHTKAFNQSVKDVLTKYYLMTGAYADGNLDAVNKAAKQLQTAISGLPIEELKKDSVIYETVRFPVDNAKASVAAILASNEWDEKKRSLHDLSENVRMLLLTVKYDQDIAYWQECSMAFGEGDVGNWLSEKEQTVNPYIGKNDPRYSAAMQGCGEVKEKIDFAADGAALK